MQDNLNTLVAFFSKISPEVIGAGLAMMVASLRVIYDKEETKPMRIVLEAVLCGLLSVTGSSAIIAMGLNPQWAVFIGGAIGYIGSASVRNIAITFLNKKLNTKP